MGPRRLTSRLITCQMQRSAFMIRAWMALRMTIPALLIAGFSSSGLWAADSAAVSHYRDKIEPILSNYCYSCHAYGETNGNVSFDSFASNDALVADRALWWRVLKNVRAGVMPPADEAKPTKEELDTLEQWIKLQAFAIDPANPDPGRVTVRRLNRTEYANTIRDLMGVEFKAEEEFPPDDTGYGFDNIGDVLTVSPLLLEKYMHAAESVVAAAVPTASKVVPERTISGRRFRTDDEKGDADDMSFYEEAKVSRKVDVEKPGTYRIVLKLSVDGDFNFDPGRCRVTFSVDDRELLKQEFGWANNQDHQFTFEEKWERGDRRLSLKLEPLTPADQKKTSVDLDIEDVIIQGPLEEEHWNRPPNFARFFPEADPKTDEEKRSYARDVLSKFAKKAFRRPVDEQTIDRLAQIAESVYTQPDKSVQAGIARAMVAVLASPRFVFRIEPQTESTGAEHPLVDEHALAIRLSYFLWSTMPDDELIGLADRGELRKNFKAQVERMLKDKRSSQLVENFTGQWLQLRDLEGISISVRDIFRREFVGDPEAFRRERRGRRPRIEFDHELRRAMKREAEMLFEHVMREDRSVLDFIDSDYTFVNERLSKVYGIENVNGDEMRRVELPDESPRGGLLTQAAMLIVTSNPTRTSPVKRGLFVLENILGTPPPPPPANVPELEDAAKAITDREPTLRETLELHRADALCSSCHTRMDPLGLALENFNALGMWREQERGNKIDTKGQLITGEAFTGPSDLKKVIKTERRVDFYRCLAEKLLTYALGRGLDYYDVHTVDEIVNRMEKEEGRFSALLMAVVESAAFQRRRQATAVPTANIPNPESSGK